MAGDRKVPLCGCEEDESDRMGEDECEVDDRDERSIKSKLSLQALRRDGGVGRVEPRLKRLLRSAWRVVDVNVVVEWHKGRDAATATSAETRCEEGRKKRDDDDDDSEGRRQRDR